MADGDNTREFDPDIVTYFRERMSYGSYLDLDTLTTKDWLALVARARKEAEYGRCARPAPGMMRRT